jgi:hypothetical protein
MGAVDVWSMIPPVGESRTKMVRRRVNLGFNPVADLTPPSRRVVVADSSAPLDPVHKAVRDLDFSSLKGRDLAEAWLVLAVQLSSKPLEFVFKRKAGVPEATRIRQVAYYLALESGCTKKEVQWGSRGAAIASIVIAHRRVCEALAPQKADFDRLTSVYEKCAFLLRLLMDGEA